MGKTIWTKNEHLPYPKGATPETHLVDAGYVDAVGLETSHHKGTDLIGPPLPNPSGQAKIEGGYDAFRFTIDWDEADAFGQLYRRREGVEGTIDNAMKAKGARRARYSGLARTHFQQLMTATAINIERATRWLLGERPKATYVSSFAALISSV